MALFFSLHSSAFAVIEGPKENHFIFSDLSALAPNEGIQQIINEAVVGVQKVAVGKSTAVERESYGVFCTAGLHTTRYFLFFVTGATDTKASSPDCIPVCSADCQYLCSNQVEFSINSGYVYIPLADVHSEFSESEKDALSLILTGILRAADSGHLHSFIFYSSHGCTNSLCTDPQHTHYCNPHCTDVTHCH